MPFDKFRQFLASEGFCCPWAILTARKRWYTSNIAQDAEMNPRAIRFWKAKLRKGLLKCENCPKGCLKEKILQDRGMSR